MPVQVSLPAVVRAGARHDAVLVPAAQAGPRRAAFATDDRIHGSGGRVQCRLRSARHGATTDPALDRVATVADPYCRCFKVRASINALRDHQAQAARALVSSTSATISASLSWVARRPAS